VNELATAPVHWTETEFNEFELGVACLSKWASTFKVELPAGQGKSASATCLVAQDRCADGRQADRVAFAEQPRRRHVGGDGGNDQMLSDPFGNRDHVQRPEKRCKLRGAQLGSIAYNERALTLLMVVAWRIAYPMRTDDACPDLDTRLFFGPDKIKAAWLSPEEAPPERPP
jgi:hypothetical protein